MKNVDLSKILEGKIGLILLSDTGNGSNANSKLRILLHIILHPEEADPNVLTKKYGKRTDIIYRLFDDLQDAGFVKISKTGAFDISPLLNHVAPDSTSDLIQLSEEDLQSLKNLCGKDFHNAYHAAASYIMSLRAESKPIRADGYTLVYKAFCGRWWEGAKTEQPQKSFAPSQSHAKELAGWLQDQGIMRKDPYSDAILVRFDKKEHAFKTHRQVFDWVTQNEDRISDYKFYIENSPTDELF